MPHLAEVIAHRPVIMSQDGMVVAGHHKAAEAGARMLRAGGNAIDAAIAASATLAIAIPNMSGLGGDAIALLARGTGEVTSINGSGAIPQAATRDILYARGIKRMPSRGPFTVSVPGVVAAWGQTLERFGTRSLAEVLEPAIELAERGIPLDSVAVAYFNSEEYSELVSQYPKLAVLFGQPNSRQLGQLLRQPACATTLRTLARSGWRCFYSGALADEWLADARSQGVLLKSADLACHETLFGSSITIMWRGKQIHVAPPNSQGLALLAMLGLSEAQHSSPLKDGSDPLFDPTDYLLRKIAAFTLRDRYCADPRRISLPPNLLSAEALATLPFTQSATSSSHSTGDTSTLVVLDSEGNAVSWVQSLFESFGSGIACASHGIVLHNRAMLETLDDHPIKGLRPGYRPFHTLCPAIATSSQGVELAMATPGDHGQPQTLFQVLKRHYEQRLDIQTAIEWPRIRHDEGNVAMLEDRCPASWTSLLEATGWVVKRVGNWSRLMGGVCAIKKENGILMGGADPRRSSYAVSA
jgi:gamma-glutamyltranspeptidase/glutathione hydrolase